MGKVDTLVQIFGIDVATEKVKAVIVDNLSGALRVIQAVHGQIHEGYSYAASEEIDTTSSNGGTFEILLDIPRGVHVHLRRYRFEVTTAPGKVELIEGADADSEGTDINPHQMNRPLEGQEEHDTHVSVTKNPTISGFDEELEVSKISGSKQSGGNADDAFEEWILKSGSTYLVRYTNQSQSDAEGVFGIMWYQHDGGHH